MQKLQFGRLQEWIHAGYRMLAQKINENLLLFNIN